MSLRKDSFVVPVNPHIQRVQNMYGKGGQKVFKAELRPAEVNPRFEIFGDANSV